LVVSHRASRSGEVVNTIRLRKRLIVHAEPEELAAELLRVESSVQDLEARERLARLDRAIAKLPSLERQVVVLRMRQELSFKQIAEVMDTPLGTVLSRMHLAKKRLKLAMETEYETGTHPRRTAPLLER